MKIRGSAIMQGLACDIHVPLAAVNFNHEELVELLEVQFWKAVGGVGRMRFCRDIDKKWGENAVPDVKNLEIDDEGKIHFVVVDDYKPDDGEEYEPDPSIRYDLSAIDNDLAICYLRLIKQLESTRDPGLALRLSTEPSK